MPFGPANANTPCHVVLLTALEPETLSQLCDNFRRDVFKTAGAQEPLTLRARAEAAEAKLRDINAALTELTPWETGGGTDVYDQDDVDAIKELLNHAD